MRRYVVTLTDGTSRTISADRHRYDDGSIVFEIQRYDESLPSPRRWQQVWALPQAKLAALEPPGLEPAPAA